PLRSGVGRGSPPDPVAQTGGVRLQSQQTWRVGEHRSRVRPGEAFAAVHVEESLGMAPGHVRVGLALFGFVAEVAPAVYHLLRRAAADAELYAATGDQVCRTGILGHV